MQIQSVRSKFILSLTALQLLATSCGDPQGNEVGKDPNISVTLKPKTPESGAPETPQTSEPAPLDGDKKSSEPTADAPGTGAPAPSPGTEPVVANPEPPPPPLGHTLTISINGIRSVRGNVCLSLFNSPDGFPDSAEKAILAECFTVVGNSFDVKIDQVPPGTYGIAMWHDENRDGKMNYNFLGIPKEGLAFSENGRPRLTPPPGPPSFQSISFEMKNEARSTPAKMTYLLDFL